MMKGSSHALRLLAMSAMLGALVGCNSPHLERKAPEHPAFVEVPPPRPVHGSIFAGAQRVALFQDMSARQVGDIVTIKLQEKTDAKKSASTTASRKTDVNQSTPTLLGRVIGAIGDDSGTSTKIDSTNDFESDADTDQANSLRGDITAVVTHVYPNGNLRIEGEKFMTLNTGEEVVRVSGIIRPVDIRPDNTVLSTQVANAEIVYAGGKGPVADTNWLPMLAKFFFSVVTLL